MTINMSMIFTVAQPSKACPRCGTDDASPEDTTIQW